MERYEKYSEKALQILSAHGAFLVAGKDSPNVTGISWGALGTFWGKPVFVLALRRTRYTYDLIKATGEFTVSIPYKDLRHELIQVSSISGKNIDKFSEVHLHSRPARSVSTYVVGECALFLECRMLCEAAMDSALLDEEIKREIYDGHDLHSLFFAEITDIYEDL